MKGEASVDTWKSKGLSLTAGAGEEFSRTQIGAPGNTWKEEHLVGLKKKRAAQWRSWTQDRQGVRE